MSLSQSSVEVSVQRILSEDMISLQEARNELAGFFGRRPDKATVYRWCLRGVDGTRLEHVRIGGRIITSRQALTRFIGARSR